MGRRGRQRRLQLLRIAGVLGPGSFELEGVVNGSSLTRSDSDPMRRSVQRFLTLARGNRTQPAFCTPQDALATLAVAISCEHALVSGETVAFPA